MELKVLLKGNKKVATTLFLLRDKYVILLGNFLLESSILYTIQCIKELIVLGAFGDQVTQTWHSIITRRQWSAAEAFSEFAASFCS